MIGNKSPSKLKRITLVIALLSIHYNMAAGAVTDYAFNLVPKLDVVANVIASGDFRGPIEVSPPGYSRAKAKMYFPNQYESREKWPLVLLLHGFTGTGVFEDLYLGLRFRTSRRGFILVTPEGIETPRGTRSEKGEDLSGKQFWNATDFCCDFGKTGVNDVAYLTKLIETLSRSYRIDQDRIYVIGHSNGGFMANRLACETGETFAAIVSLAGGSFKNQNDCRNPKPVPYLQIHAVNDETVAYGKNRNYAGGLATIDQWLKKNGCSDSATLIPRKSFLPLLLGPEVEMKSWKNCFTGKDVNLWSIQKSNSSNFNPHIPLLTWSFSEEVLDYLFEHHR